MNYQKEIDRLTKLLIEANKRKDMLNKNEAIRKEYKKLIELNNEHIEELEDNINYWKSEKQAAERRNK